MPYRRRFYPRSYSKRANKDAWRSLRTNQRSEAYGIAAEFSVSAAKLRLKEQGGKCYYCGKRLSWYPKHNNALHKAIVEHFIPMSRGGRNHITNVVISCWECNSTKGTKTGQEYLTERRASGLKVYAPFLFSGSLAEEVSPPVPENQPTAPTKILNSIQASDVINNKQPAHAVQSREAFQKSSESFGVWLSGSLIQLLKNIAIIIFIGIIMFTLLYFYYSRFP